MLALFLLITMSRAPISGVLKHSQPRRRGEIGFPLFRHPWPLPFEKATLRMWHHREMTAIRTAQCGETYRRSIRIVRIFLRRIASRIGIDERCQLLALNLLEYPRVREMRSPFAVSDPDTKH